MRTRVCLLSFATAGLMLFLSARGESPATPAEDVVPVADLAAEARAKLETLAEYTTDEEAFDKARENLRVRHAGVLACLAQAMIEHPAREPVAGQPIALREAALALRKSESLEEARAALARARAAVEAGAPADAADGDNPPRIDWKDLIDMDSLMTEINSRHVRQRFLTRRIRNPQADSLHASTAAVLATAMQAYSDYALDDEDAAKWEAWSTDYRRHMTALSAAVKAQDADLVNTHFQAGAQTCTDCHERFQVK